ncbi:MAG: lysylphosphatidylglycerol synthase transmembrane domain-containing protein, partial [Micromonosporaceae bacterium]
MLSAAVLAAGGYFVAVHARDLRAASHQLAGLRWPWICAAVLCEAGSMLVLARLQRRLLRAGGARLGIRTMLGVTVAANAMDATLPGGVAWSAAWVFNQLSRHGVPRPQRVWMFLAAGAVSSFTLFAVVATGVEIAGGTGPMSGLRIPALILAAVPVAGAGWQLLRRAPRVRRGLRAAGRRLAARSLLARRMQRVLGGFSSRLTAVRLAPGAWADALAMGLANWLLDAAVLVAVLQALAIHVPWRAILVIYGVTQVAGSLPVTPGGLGVVEGSLAGLLAAYGTGGGQALAVVMAYRVVSFWVMVPAGWLVWLHLSFWRPRRGSARAENVRNGAAAGVPVRPAGGPFSSALPSEPPPARPGRGRPGL